MKKKFFLVLKFIIPFGLWLFLFSDSVLGKLPVDSDCYSFYSLLKYFLDNLRTGHFALWCPFVMWGGSFLVELNAFGAFNPFWLLALFLNKVGLNFYLSFLWTYIGYFFIGHIGFYFLAKTYLKDKFCAYAAFLLLLFSTSGFLIFHYPYHVFIFVPLVWFFYFFIEFLQKFDKKFFVGIMFLLMIIFNCYLPFYWFSVFVFVVILYIIIYFSRIRRDFKLIIRFFVKNYVVAILCVLALCVSMVPALKAYDLTKSGEVVCFERMPKKDVYQGGALVSYDSVAKSAPSTALFVDSLMLDRDSVLPKSIVFFYVSFFVWSILLLSIFNKIKKKSIFLGMLLLILLFILIVDQSIVFKGIFYLFFWFSYIRNIGLFSFIFLPVLILFSALQLKSIRKEKLFDNRYSRLVAIFIVHAGLLTFLILSNGLFSSYLAVSLSFLFFILIALQARIQKWLWIVLLGLCVVSQPVEVMWRFRDNIQNMSFSFNKLPIFNSINYPPAKIKFNYSRVIFDSKNKYKIKSPHASRIQMADLINFVNTGAGFPPKWSFYLSKNISEEELNQYVQHKFYIYDHVKVIDSEDESLNLLKEIFEKNINLALISKDKKRNENNFTAGLEINGQINIIDRAKIILSSSNLFSVLDFNTNSIKVETNFDKEKFLVYTDSFQSDWRVFVNGQEQDLCRSNFGFKGVALPRGQNIVLFEYSPLGGQLIYFLIFFIYIGLFLWLIILFLWPSRNRKKEDF